MTKVHGNQSGKTAHSTQSSNTTHGSQKTHGKAHEQQSIKADAKNEKTKNISDDTRSTPTQSQPVPMSTQSASTQTTPAQTAPTESPSKSSLIDILNGHKGASYTDPTSGKTYTDPKATGTWTDPETGKTHWQYPATGAASKSGPPSKPISYYPIGQEGGWGLTA